MFLYYYLDFGTITAGSISCPVHTYHCTYFVENSCLLSLYLLYFIFLVLFCACL
jgi:hypothetical protein